MGVKDEIELEDYVSRPGHFKLMRYEAKCLT